MTLTMTVMKTQLINLLPHNLKVRFLLATSICHLHVTLYPIILYLFRLVTDFSLMVIFYIDTDSEEYSDGDNVELDSGENISKCNVPSASKEAANNDTHSAYRNQMRDGNYNYCIDNVA